MPASSKKCVDNSEGGFSLFEISKDSCGEPRRSRKSLYGKPFNIFPQIQPAVPLSRSLLKQTSISGSNKSINSADMALLPHVFTQLASGLDVAADPGVLEIAAHHNRNRKQRSYYSYSHPDQ